MKHKHHKTDVKEEAEEGLADQKSSDPQKTVRIDMDGKESATPAGKEKAPGLEDVKKEYEARLLRLQADFENFRKRVLREKNELYSKANEDIMLELLPVLDHMELALRSAAEHRAPDAFIEGFKLVFEQMLSALGKFGLLPFDAQGLPFDPNEHEAVSHITSDTAPENTVMEQTRRGYKLVGRLLRAAQVVVSGGKAQTGGVQACDESGMTGE